MASVPGTKSIGTFIRAKNDPTSDARGSELWLWPAQRMIGAFELKSIRTVESVVAWARIVPPKLRNSFLMPSLSIRPIRPHEKSVTTGSRVSRSIRAARPRALSVIQYSIESGSKCCSVGWARSATTTWLDSSPRVLSGSINAKPRLVRTWPAFSSQRPSSGTEVCSIVMTSP